MSEKEHYDPDDFVRNLGKFSGAQGEDLRKKIYETGNEHVLPPDERMMLEEDDQARISKEEQEHNLVMQRARETSRNTARNNGLEGQDMSKIPLKNIKGSLDDVIEMNKGIKNRIAKYQLEIDESKPDDPIREINAEKIKRLRKELAPYGNQEDSTYPEQKIAA